MSFHNICSIWNQRIILRLHEHTTYHLKFECNSFFLENYNTISFKQWPQSFETTGEKKDRSCDIKTYIYLLKCHNICYILLNEGLQSNPFDNPTLLCKCVSVIQYLISEYLWFLQHLLQFYTEHYFHSICIVIHCI